MNDAILDSVPSTNEDERGMRGTNEGGMRNGKHEAQMRTNGKREAQMRAE